MYEFLQKVVPTLEDLENTDLEMSNKQQIIHLNEKIEEVIESLRMEK